AALCIGLWLGRRGGWTDLQRAGLILWGGWMLAGAVVFSYAGGIVHQYYTVAIAPAVAALAPIGGGSCSGGGAGGRRRGLPSAPPWSGPQPWRSRCSTTARSGIRGSAT